jgi:hypothetical protein
VFSVTLLAATPGAVPADVRGICPEAGAVGPPAERSGRIRFCQASGPGRTMGATDAATPAARFCVLLKRFALNFFGLFLVSKPLKRLRY